MTGDSPESSGNGEPIGGAGRVVDGEIWSVKPEIDWGISKRGSRESSGREESANGRSPELKDHSWRRRCSGCTAVLRLVPANGEVVWVCKWLERVRGVVLYLDDMGRNLERVGFSAFIAEAMARRSGVSAVRGATWCVVMATRAAARAWRGRS